MNFNDLSKFVFQKYGLKFLPAVPGSTELYVLKSPNDGSYFAMMSRIKYNGKFIPTLDLRCGDFSEMIRDLPGFTTAFRLKSSEWIGIWLSKVNREAIENAFDYSFKLAMNGDEKSALKHEPYIYVPGDAIDNKYQAQIIKPRANNKQSSHSKVPQAIQRMLSSYDYSILPAKGRAKNFYHQGKMMADFEDNYQNFSAFKRYYPTYHDMTVPQLRTYFTWRTKIRKQNYQKTSTSYAFVYVYELLNNIGIEDPEVGFHKLVDFQKNYVQKYDLEVEAYLKKWIQDYVLYYNLTKERELVFADELKGDRAYHILLHPEKYTAEDVYQVFTQLSSYLNENYCVKKIGSKYSMVLFEVWKKVLNLKKSNKHSFFNQYIATRNLLVENLFSGAVFYKNHLSKIQDFAVDSERSFYFKGGNCYCSKLIPLKNQKSNLNTFLHEVDRLVRIEFHLGRPLKPRKIEKECLQAISQGIKAFKIKEEKAKVSKIKIDFSNLQQIREDASITRDSLLTDEEKIETEVTKEPISNQIKHEEQVSKTDSLLSDEQNDYDLSSDELFFLNTLLTGADWQERIKKKHLMPSILADSINDKLFDEIGDAVIEFNENDQPEIIADYVSDLKEIFLKEHK